MSVGTVLVTGGASGLGAAVAEAVDKAGGRPYVLDVVAPDSAYDRTVVDLADTAAATRAVEEAIERTGGLQAVVTCAGTDACGKLEDVPRSQWEHVVAVNLLGTAAVIRAALPSLRAEGGRIVTVASTLGLRALPDATAYCASKFGVVGFTRALAAELAGDVGVTMLVPGGMQTAFFDGRTEQYRPPADAMLNAPEDVARAVVFALEAPAGCEVREMVVTPAVEPSWP
ncbi:SDR family oxidoreductase [Mumia sp. DW29H23]|uniref:SDR family oxidoreductase n=1 Tax=Mumia sp. DW29H23 TaxID=3421241 RepID=UPI003D69586A